MTVKDGDDGLSFDGLRMSGRKALTVEKQGGLECLPQWRPAGCLTTATA